MPECARSKSDSFLLSAGKYHSVMVRQLETALHTYWFNYYYGMVASVRVSCFAEVKTHLVT
jgi:hypothetical protein